MNEPRKIKVLYVITGLAIGGAEQLLLHTVRSLDRKRFTPVVTALLSAEKATDCSNDNLIPQIEALGVSVVTLDMKHKLDLGALFRFSKLLNQERPDIVHTHLPHADLLGRVVAHWCKVPTILSTIHAIEPIRFKKIFQTVDRWTSKFAHGLLATSQEVKDTVVQLEGLDPQKIKVLRNTVRIEKFYHPKHRLEKRKELGLAPDSVLIGIVGRLVDSHKGHSILIRALKRIEAKHPQATVVFLGDGPDREMLEKLTCDLHLQGRILFAGMQQEISEWLFALDLFVLPSHWEGLPLAIIEAMAAGCPIITTPVGGNREMLEDESSCLFVPPNDPKELAAAMDELLTKPYRAAELGAAAKDRFEREYDMRRAIHKLQAYYEQFALETQSPRIRLLEVVTSFDQGGVSAHLEHLVHHFPTREFEIELACGREEFQAERVKALGIPYHFVGLCKRIAPLQDLLALWDLVRVIRKGKFQVVHTHMAKADWIGGLAAKCCRVPFVVSTAHGATVLSAQPTVKQKVFDVIERWTYRSLADLVIAVSKATAAHLIRKGAVQPEKVAVIHNGIDLDVMHGTRSISHLAEKREVQQRIRKRLEIAAGQPVVLMVGRLAYPKAPEVLVDAIQSLRERIPNVLCLIAGDGPERPALVKRIARDYLHGSVEILGGREDIHELLQASDLLVLASHSEGMPICVLEAMACGVPVVASDVGGIGELIDDKKTGMLFEVGRPDQLAEILYTLLSKPLLRTSMAEVAYGKLKSSFQAKRKIKELAGILAQFKELVDVKSSSAIMPPNLREQLQSLGREKGWQYFGKTLLRRALSPAYYRESFWFLSRSVDVPMARMKPRIDCEVRKAGVKDFEAIQAFLEQDALVVKQMLRSPSFAAFIALWEGKVIGIQWALKGPESSFEVEPFRHFVKLTDREGYLFDLRVSAHHRSHGIAPALEWEVWQWFRQQGIQNVYTDILEHNEPAIRSMEKVGFQKMERVVFTRILGKTKVRCDRPQRVGQNPFQVLWVGRERQDPMALNQWHPYLSSRHLELLEPETADLAGLLRVLQARNVNLIHCEGVRNTLMVWVATRWVGFRGAVTLSLIKTKYRHQLKRLHWVKGMLEKMDAVFIPASVSRDETLTPPLSCEAPVYRLNDEASSKMEKQPWIKSIARTVLKISKEGPLVGTLMPLEDPAKVWELMRTFRAIHQSVPGCRFLVAGDGPLYMTLKAFAEEYGLKKQIKLLRRNFEKAVILKALDVYLDTHPEETHPDKLDAIATQRPVVRLELARKTAEKVCELLNDPDAQHKMSQEAYLDIERDFKRRYLAGQFVSAWENILGQRPQSVTNSHWKGSYVGSTFSRSS